MEHNIDPDQMTESAMRERYPGQQIYSGNLPCHDVIWNGDPGWYTYVLADRRKRDKDNKLKFVVLAVGN